MVLSTVLLLVTSPGINWHWFEAGFFATSTVADPEIILTLGCDVALPARGRSITTSISITMAHVVVTSTIRYF